MTECRISGKVSKNCKTQTRVIIRIKHVFILIALLLFSFAANAQKKNVTKPLSFQQLQDSMQKKPKPILLNLFTDWCLYCKMQDKQIEKSDSLQKILQQHFYYVQMDAETKVNIVLNGTEYKGRANGLSAAAHELAETLGKENGQLSYPIIIVLDKNYKPIFKSHGFIDSRKLSKVLLPIAELSK
jgi:thioredoxin-related protein